MVSEARNRVRSEISADYSLDKEDGVDGADGLALGLDLQVDSRLRWCTTSEKLGVLRVEAKQFLGDRLALLLVGGEEDGRVGHTLLDEINPP